MSREPSVGMFFQAFRDVSNSLKYKDYVLIKSTVCKSCWRDFVTFALIRQNSLSMTQVIEVEYHPANKPGVD